MQHLTTNRRNVWVDTFAVLFGIGTWIGINSTYLQLPLLVASAAEGWALPSFIVIVIQLANIGPILYTIIQKYSPRKMNDSYLIYGLYVIGIVGALLMALFYDRTVVVGTTERSVPLLAIVFLLALVGCTSSVLYMPYMGRFKDIYLITYLIGEGLSGFLPSIVALIQGVGGNAECVESANSTIEFPSFELYNPPARFGTFEFFLFVCGVFVISSVAFLLLDKHRISKREYAAVVIRSGNHYEYEKKDQLADVPMSTVSANEDQLPETKENTVTRSQYYYLVVMLTVVCMFGNGVFPSVQSYSCLPYGNVAYHLTVTLSSIANPLACFLAVFYPVKSVRGITIWFALGALIGVYGLATAVMSPSPPLVDSTWGEVLVVSGRDTQGFLDKSLNMILFVTGPVLDVTHGNCKFYSTRNYIDIPRFGWQLTRPRRGPDTAGIVHRGNNYLPDDPIYRHLQVLLPRVLILWVSPMPGAIFTA